MKPPGPRATGLRFPENRSVGQVLVRDWGSSVFGGFNSWNDMGFERIAEAQGTVSVPAAKIETFFGGGPNMTDASMAVFGGWGDTLLQIRTGWDSDHVTDDGMAHMARCHQLTNMFLPQQVTWRGVAYLKTLPLQTIVVWGNKNIDDHALKMLAPIWEQMPTLRFIFMG